MKSSSVVEEISHSEGGVPTGFDVNRIREDFPILSREVHGKPLVFLDNAASTQKPRRVLDALQEFYREEYANIHRGVYYLSELATRKYEAARETVRRFLNAASPREIIFTGGTTDSINLVAAGFGRKFIREGDEIILSHMEHHSNIVPWQILCEQTGARLRVIPMNDRGELLLEEYQKLFTPRTRLVSVVYVSNSLGTINPVEEIIRIAHGHGVPVLVDAAQTVQHKKVDVQALDCDFLAFSGHKIFGPTGIGVLYGRESLLEKMDPYRGGGDMILTVTFEKTTYNELPHKFEAGTPHIAGVIGLGEALKYVQEIGLEAIERHEAEVLAHGTEVLSDIPGLKIIGTAERKAGVISFVIEDIHPHDIGTFLDREGIAIRTGHHCTQPVMEHFKIPATSRASIALYNTPEEFDKLAEGLHKVIKMFRG
ncbi:MAG: cysteine desulfurase [Calditrichaeota bacterium]|nr:MAG: cysteine desulfurase [Calditrichota bacterium]